MTEETARMRRELEQARRELTEIGDALAAGRGHGRRRARGDGRVGRVGPSAESVMGIALGGVTVGYLLRMLSPGRRRLDEPRRGGP